ncbi:MAG: zinc ribbon domain-containing protein [Candidatus Kariarchaeaceae archaeon]|jgi:hypothetical protein
MSETTYCPNCGSPNPVASEYCTGCGTRLEPQKGGITYATPPSAITYQIGEVPKRNYWQYILPGFISPFFFVIIALWGGYLEETPGQSYAGFFSALAVLFVIMTAAALYALYYYFRNFADFRLMMAKYHPNVYPAGQDPIVMLVLYFVFSPLFLYFKYEQLHTHLRDLHNETNLPPSGWKIIALLVATILIPVFGAIAFIFPLVISGSTSILGLIFVTAIVPMAIGLYFLYLEYNWQARFNEHVLSHEAQ